MESHHSDTTVLIISGKSTGVCKIGGKGLKRSRIFAVAKVSTQKYVSIYKGKIYSGEA